MPRSFYTLAEIKAFNKAKGNHFFDLETLKFFNSLIHPNIYGGNVFITSEQYSDETPREWRLRKILDDGSIETIEGPENTYSSFIYADLAAKAYVNA